MNRKLICILLVGILLISCVSEEEVFDNKIFPSEISEEEQGIIDLIGGTTELSIFDFEVFDPFNYVSIWVESYIDGVYQIDRGKMQSMLTDSKGQFAIRVDRLKKSDWIISYSNEGRIATSAFPIENGFIENSSFAEATSSLSDETEVIDDKEIILKIYLYNKNGSISVYNTEMYLKDTNLLKEYEYAFVVKCKFSSVSEIE